MMNTMMEQTIISGTARKADIPGWTAAGKTGTSQDFRDAWFVGYTAKLVTGVWLGNDDNTPTRKATGGGLPVEIWTRFMRAAHQGLRPEPIPGTQRGPLPDIAQLGRQVVAPPVPVPAAAPAPVGSRSQPVRSDVRPEAASGLDGWLVDRLFGGR
jgi:penicillin-binding protein 1A